MSNYTLGNIIEISVASGTLAINVLLLLLAVTVWLKCETFTLFPFNLFFNQTISALMASSLFIVFVMYEEYVYGISLFAQNLMPKNDIWSFLFIIGYESNNIIML
jgi:hypothetical protein